MLDKKKNCLCGSGKIYGDCCFKKPSISEKLATQLLADARTHYKRYRIACIIPDNDGKLCNETSIESHNLQENGILSLLQVDGHIYEVGFDPIKSKGDFSLKKVGVGESTIFRAICLKHDQELFEEIEKKPYKKTAIQNFQLALKAILLIYWKELAAQALFEKQIARHNIFCSEAAVVEFIQHKIDLARVKSNFNKFVNAVHTQNFHDFKSIVIKLEYEIQFSCSIPLHFVFDLYGSKRDITSEELFKYDGASWGLVSKENYPFIYLSAFPQDGKSFVVLTWHDDDKENLKDIILQFQKLRQSDKLKVLNILMPIVAENIIISPRLVESWNEQQKKEFLRMIHPFALSIYNGDDNANGINFLKAANNIHYNLFTKIKK